MRARQSMTAAEVLFGDSPALAALEAWDEMLHPRGPGGKFAKLGDAEREARRVARNEARKATRAAAKTTGSAAKVVEKPHTHESILAHAHTMSNEDLAKLHHAIAGMHHDRQVKAAVSAVPHPPVIAETKGSTAGHTETAAALHALADRLDKAPGGTEKSGFSTEGANDVVRQIAADVASGKLNRDTAYGALEKTLTGLSSGQETPATAAIAETLRAMHSGGPVKGPAPAKMAAGRSGLPHPPAEAAQRLSQMRDTTQAKQYLAKATKADLLAILKEQGQTGGASQSKTEILRRAIGGVRARSDHDAIMNAPGYQPGAPHSVTRTGS